MGSGSSRPHFYDALFEEAVTEDWGLGNDLWVRSCSVAPRRLFAFWRVGEETMVAEESPSGMVHVHLLRVGRESLPHERSDQEYVLLPRSVLEAAQQADQPFRPAAPPDLPTKPRTHESFQGRASPDTHAVEAATRLTEALRLLGPAPDTSPHPMAQRVGPVLSTHKVVEATRTSRQNLAAQAKKRRLIRLASSQRTQWWPTFQFRRAGDRVVPHPGVQALWGALPLGTVTDWDHAAWLCTPRHDLDDDAPIDLATDAQAIDREPLRDVVASYVDRLTR